MPLSAYEVARDLAASEGHTYRFWRDSWICWDGIGYQQVSEQQVEGWILERLKSSDLTDNLKLSRIRRVADHLKILSNLPDTTPPFGLGGQGAPWAWCTLSLQNGLLDLSGLLMQREGTPSRHGFQPANYAHKPGATCPLWRRFLRKIWSWDDPSIGILQEWFGYCLLPDNSHQKILAIYGPPGGGKSTIANVLAELVGRRNAASPSLRSFCGKSGLWSLRDKLVAFIPDPTSPRRWSAVEERLSLVSGGDVVEILRNHQPSPSAQRLPTRFVILANEPPAFLEPSGVLASRVIPLRAEATSVGHEDMPKSDELLSELPGILNWSLDGLYRLRVRGRFELPSGS